MNGQPPVLLYHAIGSVPADAEPVERDMLVAPEDFEWQMADLASRGYRSLTLDEFWAALGQVNGGDRAFLLTFDDAYAEVDTIVTPILRRHGFTAVMFAPYQHLGGRNSWDAEHKYLATLAIASCDQLRSMASGPWEIASHGLRHIDLVALTPERRNEELIESRERLAALIGQPVRDLAYPYGRQSDQLRTAARAAGYRMAFTAGRSAQTDRFALDRRPIHGPDSRAVFRIKTSRSASLLFGLADLTPAWAHSAARRVVASVTSGRG